MSALLFALICWAQAAQPIPDPPPDLVILHFNDFHGQVQPSTASAPPSSPVRSGPPPTMPNAAILKTKLLTAPEFINDAIENAEKLMGMNPYEWSTTKLAEAKKRLCADAKGVNKFLTAIETLTE